MKRYIILLAVVLIGSAKLFAKTNDKPNVVIIFCDDLGYSDIECFGAEGFETPNIDKLARKGRQFTDFYSASSVCSPSRAALLTGSHPVRIGIPSVLFPPRNGEEKVVSLSGLNPDEETLPELLKEVGYNTACVGKWHIGHRAEFMPLQHGFDEYFGLPYSNDMRPERSKAYPDLPLLNGVDTVELNPDQSTLTTRYTEYAVDFIKRNKENPFFLYLPHSMPHIPLYVSDKFAGKSEKGIFGDVVMEIDWSVGEIMKTLKKLKLVDNTIVIFSSDNGPWIAAGEHGGSARPLREGKFEIFDGGLKVPCVMSWPAKIPKGTICTEMCSTMDLLPTLVNIAGGRMPKETIDGLDIQNLLYGVEGAKTPHEALYFYQGKNLYSMRSGDWKCHREHPYKTVVKPGVNGKTGQYAKKHLAISLFDVKNKPQEFDNVAAQHPQIVDSLLQMMDDYELELQQNARPCGRVEL